jgi:hypothetical protein
MGIYSNDKVYGFRWTIYDLSDNIIHEYEKIYDHEMTIQEIKEAKEEYYKLSEDDRKEVSIRYYTSLVSTHNPGISDVDPVMAWWPSFKESFENFLMLSDQEPDAS